MTITVLAAHRDGEFNFSGLHQDILVYRFKNGQIEAFETSGMWLGIVPDIETLVTNDSLKLNIGDAILLFTDGITEARKKGHHETEGVVSDMVMHGDEKLHRIFRENGNKKAVEIKNVILDSLRGYNFNDDMTLVVLKRME